MAVNVDREFAVGKMAAGAFQDRRFESYRPGRHALEKFRGRLGGKRNQRAVIFALRSILHDGVLIRRDAQLFRPERRARGAVAVFHVARPIAIGGAEIKSSGKRHRDDFDAELGRQQARDPLDGFKIRHAAVKQKHRGFPAVRAARNARGILGRVDYRADVPVHFQLADAENVFALVDRDVRQGSDFAVEAYYFFQGDGGRRLPIGLCGHR